MMVRNKNETTRIIMYIFIYREREKRKPKSKLNEEKKKEKPCFYSLLTRIKLHGSNNK